MTPRAGLLSAPALPCRYAAPKLASDLAGMYTKGVAQIYSVHLTITDPDT